MRSHSLYPTETAAKIEMKWEVRGTLLLAKIQTTVQLKQSQFSRDSQLFGSFECHLEFRRGMRVEVKEQIWRCNDVNMKVNSHFGSWLKVTFHPTRESRLLSFPIIPVSTYDNFQRMWREKKLSEIINMISQRPS